MAFDVVKDFDHSVPDRDLPKLEDFDFGPKVGEPTRIRKIGLFEGTDEYGRLQPLLGVAEPATDYKGDPIYWPDTEPYQEAGLAGKQIEGTVAWHRYECVRCFVILCFVVILTEFLLIASFHLVDD